jgi:hypothetical protein
MVLRLLYKNASGVVKAHSLKAWAERGHYITGFSEEDGGPRTFLKFRVLEYLDGSEAALAQPYMPPPPSPAPRAAPDSRPQILFTGFAQVRRAQLEAQASEAGMKVVKTVTNGLALLCCGPNAGPKKLHDAQARGSITLSEATFRRLCETGEVPDPYLEEGVADV